MGVSASVLWVISLRTDVISWYERRGYVATGETAPFPPAEANVGSPRRADLKFIRMQKTLPIRQDALPGGSGCSSSTD